MVLRKGCFERSMQNQASGVSQKPSQRLLQSSVRCCREVKESETCEETFVLYIYEVIITPKRNLAM